MYSFLCVRECAVAAQRSYSIIPAAPVFRRRSPTGCVYTESENERIREGGIIVCPCSASVSSARRFFSFFFAHRGAWPRWSYVRRKRVCMQPMRNCAGLDSACEKKKKWRRSFEEESEPPLRVGRRVVWPWKGAAVSDPDGAGKSNSLLALSGRDVAANYTLIPRSRIYALYHCATGRPADCSFRC